MLCRLISMTLFVLILSMGEWGLAQSQHKMTKADVDKQIKEFSNWGRWGKGDQLGTLNLITAKKRVQAAQLVKLGVSVSLARKRKPSKLLTIRSHLATKCWPGEQGTAPGPWITIVFPTTAWHTRTWIRFATCSMKAKCTTVFRGSRSRKRVPVS